MIFRPVFATQLNSGSDRVALGFDPPPSPARHLFSVDVTWEDLLFLVFWHDKYAEQDSTPAAPDDLLVLYNGTEFATINCVHKAGGLEPSAISVRQSGESCCLYAESGESWHDALGALVDAQSSTSYAQHPAIFRGRDAIFQRREDELNPK